MWLKRDPDATDDGRRFKPAVVFVYLGMTGLIVAGFVIQMAKGHCPVP
ncbi:MAG TPA: hypothetical protein VKU40_17595 [Thermoanaerobaculia bacterium]|nr:hypothetical protein [Thermoanaerobaculia bacterium]